MCSTLWESSCQERERETESKVSFISSSFKIVPRIPAQNYLNLLDLGILPEMLIHFGDGLQWIQQFSVLPCLGELGEAFDASDQHMKMVEGRDGGRQVPFGAVQLLDVARDFLNHFLGVLCALLNLADLAKELADYLMTQRFSKN